MTGFEYVYDLYKDKGWGAFFADALDYTFNGIFDAVVSIYEVIVSLFTMLGETLVNLPYVIGLMTSFMANIGGYFSWLPSSVASVLLVVFSLVITYLIIDRK